MKILLAGDMRRWDQYTIEHEPISSQDLMERAATKCVDWLLQNETHPSSYCIFCGTGNNGGDGLAIARILSKNSRKVQVAILDSGKIGTDDFKKNLLRLQEYSHVSITIIDEEKKLLPFTKNDLIIDALFGSGINRPLSGIASAIVKHINQSRCKVVSIDIPSGLYSDSSSLGNAIVQADNTLSFQIYKQALLVAENADYIGEVNILDIGLQPGFYGTVKTKFELVDSSIIQAIYKKRKSFGHKGSFGHALMVAGSYGKMGAALLSAHSCLRSGVGLLSCHIPSIGYSIMQTYLPEAMVISDFNSSYNTKIDHDLSRFRAVGIGPGIGTANDTTNLLRELLQQYKGRFVLDADALNCIAMEKDMLAEIPEGAILTPHPKEFERIFGTTANEFDRISLAMQKAEEYGIVIVLKGHHTLIATPAGKGFFNSTGNAGMATGGSGDVLTGILTGLLAQDYSPVHAAVLGTYLHGLAGDFAAREISEEAMIASDIISSFGKAFLHISTPSKPSD